jgi:hypothetical protein
MPEPPTPEKREELPLSKAAEYLLDECRMVLPGIQALFGFQLIAVFNSSFELKLSGNAAFFLVLWFVLPRTRGLQRAIAGSRN